MCSSDLRARRVGQPQQDAGARSAREARSARGAHGANPDVISAHVPTDPPALSNTDPACVPFLRTQRRLSAWRKIGAPARILSWLSKGVPLPWSQRGPPPRFDHGQYLLTDPDEIAAWQELRAEYTQTRAIQPIPAQQARYVSRAFLVKKPTEHGRKKFRLVIDLRKVNRHLRKLGLRYERLKDFGHLLHRDDWMIGFDIKNAYHHLRILEAHRQFLQFPIAGEKERESVLNRDGVSHVVGAVLWTLSCHF